MHPSDLCGYWSIGLPDPNRLSGQDGRDGVLVDELRLPVSPEQNGIAVEPCHMTLKPDATDQKDRDRNPVLAQVLQHGVLERVRAFYGHLSVFLEVFTPRPATATFSAHRPPHVRQKACSEQNSACDQASVSGGSNASTAHSRAGAEVGPGAWLSDTRPDTPSRGRPRASHGPV